MEWVPQALVIGPQGVLDVVNMTGKLVKEFAGLKDVGKQLHLQWVIYFPGCLMRGSSRDLFDSSTVKRHIGWRLPRKNEPDLDQVGGGVLV